MDANPLIVDAIANKVTRDRTRTIPSIFNTIVEDQITRVVIIGFSKVVDLPVEDPSCDQFFKIDATDVILHKF